MPTGAASEPRIWDPVETLAREALRALQLERLRATVGRVLEGQPLGAQRLAQAGIASAEDVVSLEDLREIPFAVKADLRAHYPFGLLAVPREQLVRVHASSGTHGKPTVVAEVLVATPSYALTIAQAVLEGGADARALRLELGLFGGEPWTEGMRAEVQEALGLCAVNFYGPSELCGPGVATECLTARRGLHLQEDHFLVEVVDPDDGRPLASGEEGELVFTTLTKEALPLIRYRSGDIGRVIEQPCECGRTTARLTGLRGRRDEMLIVRGVNLYPSQVEQVLLGVPGAAPHYRLILERSGAMDELTLECEPVAHEVEPESLREQLQRLLKEYTGIRIAVTVAEPGSIPRSEGKAARIADRRGDG